MTNSRIKASLSMQDLKKTKASLQAIRHLVISSLDKHSSSDFEQAFDHIQKDLRKALGIGWSLVTAAQYLTGQRADLSIKKWPTQILESGFTPQQAEALIMIANDMCANISPRGELSSGLLVEIYKQHPLAPEDLVKIFEA